MQRSTERIRISPSARQRIFWITAAVLVAAVIFAFSSQGTRTSEDLSDIFAGYLRIEQKEAATRASNQSLFLGLTLRKLAHVFLFTLLGFCLYYAFQGIRARFFWAAGIGFIYGALDEYHQSMAGRYGRWRDVRIDLSGVLLGIGLACAALFLLRALRKRFERTDPKKLLQLERILDVLSLAAVMQYVFYRFLQSTMFTFYYSTRDKMATMLLLIATGGIRFFYLVLKKCWNAPDHEAWSRLFLRYALAFCLAVPFVYVGWRHDYKWLIFLPITVLCLYDMEAGKILRTFTVTVGILLGGLVLCCLSGTVRNLVVPWGRYVGAFGTINTTDFASYFTFLLVTAWCGMRNRKWYSTFLFCALVFGVTYLVWWHTDSRTVHYSGALLIGFALWDWLEGSFLRKHRGLRTVGKALNWACVAAFPLIGILTFWLVIRFGAQDPWVLQLERVLSGRLATIWRPLQAYGVRALGNTMASGHGIGGTIVPYWSAGYGYIDVAYGMLAIKYGWVIALIVTGLWIWTTARALAHGNHRIAFAMVILAFHGFSEARILDINYNIFLAMPFCAMDIPREAFHGEAATEGNARAFWIPVATGAALVGGAYLLLPRGLSWLRTFFALKGWNGGTAAFGSLAVCAALFLLLWLLWKAASRILVAPGKKRLAIFAGTVVLLVGGLLAINGTIEDGGRTQADRLEQEMPIVRQVREAAAMPVYAAEPEELYQRAGAGLPKHIFSSDELGRGERGSLFVDQSVEALSIIRSGGQYAQISEWSGLYSYDPAVIEALTNLGYEWTPFYSGLRRVNLADAAQFNEKKLTTDGIHLQKGERIETKNMEMDFLGGTYEICFTLSSLKAEGESGSDIPISSLSDAENAAEPDPWEGRVACFEVIGEAGDRVLYQDWLSEEDFDSQGRCVRRLDCQIGSVPRVFFALETAENVALNVEEITWRRI